MKFPPENFEKMREFLILLRQGDIELDVGRKSLNALIKMVNSPDAVAINNIVELAEITGVSPASITRLAKLLGFKGFNQFQLIFKQRAKVPNDYYSQKVIDLSSASGKTNRELMQQQLAATASNMQDCIDNVSNDEVNAATKLLAETRRVFVFGHKQSSALANILVYGLSLIRYEVHNLGRFEHGLAIWLGQLKKNDLIVIFGSSPYSNLTVDIASMTHSLDCKVLTITDSVLSPLNDCATVSINVPTDGYYYTNSLSANLIFLESLLSITATKIGASAIKKLQSHEDLLTKLNINS